MSIAEQARDSAIHCEAKKHAYRQTQDGVVVSFVLHPQEVPDGLATAPLGARYVLALVQIGEDELPVRREVVPAVNDFTQQSAARPRQNSPQVIADGAKRMDWRDVQPSAQSGIRRSDPEFWAFLREQKHYHVRDKDGAGVAIRNLCGVASCSEFSSNHEKRILWKQLDDEFTLWQQTGRIAP